MSVSGVEIVTHWLKLAARVQAWGKIIPALTCDITASLVTAIFCWKCHWRQLGNPANFLGRVWVFFPSNCFLLQQDLPNPNPLKYSWHHLHNIQSPSPNHANYMYETDLPHLHSLCSAVHSSLPPNTLLIHTKNVTMEDILRQFFLLPGSDPAWAL